MTDAQPAPVLPEHYFRHESGRLVSVLSRRFGVHRVELCEQRLSASIHQGLRKWQQSFARIAHTLDALSPLAVLERGYAICLTPEGKVIRSADSVAVDDSVKVQLHEGSLSARVISKERNPTT